MTLYNTLYELVAQGKYTHACPVRQGQIALFRPVQPETTPYAELKTSCWEVNFTWPALIGPSGWSAFTPSRIHPQDTTTLGLLLKARPLTPEFLEEIEVLTLS